MFEIRRLHPLYGAEIVGVDTGRPMDDAAFAAIRAAFEEHSVLLFRDQDLDDPRQIAFSERFGPLESTVSANSGGGGAFARQSNIDVLTGEPIPPDDKRMLYQKANMLWHSDSSFKPVPSLCSLLSARVVPPSGGATEFATMRAAYDDLPEATKRRLEGLVASHSLVYSRSLVDPDVTVMTEMQKAEVPPARQVMVRTNPVNGRKALYVGSHAFAIDGWPDKEARAFIAELTEHATQPKYVLRHEWREGDMIVWDNRAVLHRATPYDNARHRRLMQRTTVAGDAPTVPAAA
ncbi:MAG: TauD/TfdA dioxygenase family protein [Alphaproteobacteria bacterium]